MPKNLSRLKPEKTGRRHEQTQSSSSDLVIKSGARNDFFFRTSCFLRRRFEDEDAVEAMLEALNDEFTETPLSPGELRSVIQSSGNYVEDTTALFGPPKTTEPLPMEFLYYPYIPYFGVTPDPFRCPCPTYVDGVGRIAPRDHIDACALRQIRSVGPFNWFGKVNPHSAPICERPRG